MKEAITFQASKDYFMNIKEPIAYITCYLLEECALENHDITDTYTKCLMQIKESGSLI